MPARLPNGRRRKYDRRLVDVPPPYVVEVTACLDADDDGWWDLFVAGQPWGRARAGVVNYRLGQIVRETKRDWSALVGFKVKVVAVYPEGVGRSRRRGRRQQRKALQA